MCAFAVRNVHTIHDTYAESTTARPRSHASFLSVSFIRSFVCSIETLARSLSLDLFCPLLLSFSPSSDSLSVCVRVCFCFGFFSHVNTFNHVCNRLRVSLSTPIRSFHENYAKRTARRTVLGCCVLSARAGIALDNFYLDGQQCIACPIDDTIQNER